MNSLYRLRAAEASGPMRFQRIQPWFPPVPDRQVGFGFILTLGVICGKSVTARPASSSSIPEFQERSIGRTGVRNAQRGPFSAACRRCRRNRRTEYRPSPIAATSNPIQVAGKPPRLRGDRTGKELSAANRRNGRVKCPARRVVGRSPGSAGLCRWETACRDEFPQVRKGGSA